jgi:hypothetical protein
VPNAQALYSGQKYPIAWETAKNTSGRKRMRQRALKVLDDLRKKFLV